MANVKISDYMFGIVFFTLFISSGVYMISDVYFNSNPSISQEEILRFNKTFNKYQDLDASVSKFQDNIEGSGAIGTTDIATGLNGVLGSLVLSSWNALQFIFTSLGFATSIFSGLSYFGLPEFVGAILLLAVTIMLAFTIYSAIFQKDI
jgi:hypothetical protein